jgi:penicillin amidase
MALQTDNFNAPAAMLMPLFLKNMKENELSVDEKKYFDQLKGWDLRNDAGSKGATVFELLWINLQDTVFNDEYVKAPKVIIRPFESTLLEGILKDSAYKFLDNINTPQTETLGNDLMAAFKKTIITLKNAENEGKLDWDKYKATRIDHLAKLAPFSRSNLPIGGGTHNINATKSTHGPSWRMVISLTAKTEAFGVYPGGQSGNPGSKFYDSFVDQWAAGKYYSLWMMTKEEVGDKRVLAKMSFSN